MSTVIGKQLHQEWLSVEQQIRIALPPENNVKAHYIFTRNARLYDKLITLSTNSDNILGILRIGFNFFS